jgi:hypothetical protein
MKFKEMMSWQKVDANDMCIAMKEMYDTMREMHACKKAAMQKYIDQNCPFKEGECVMVKKISGKIKKAYISKIKYNNVTGDFFYCYKTAKGKKFDSHHVICMYPA